MSGPDKQFPNIAYEDSPSSIARDAIHPDVGGTPTNGAAPASHPELSASLKDAQLARIAPAETNGEFTSIGGGGAGGDNDPVTLVREGGAAYFSSAKLSGRGD